ncbi:MAG TPA: hypothetical protein VF176_00260 [Solirubrobacterales bacterium]
MGWLRRNAAIVLLGVALLASAALLLAFFSGLTFFQDTWAFFMHRRGTSASDFLNPHNEHIVLIPVAIEKVLIALFGMSTAKPEQVVLIVSLLITAVLLFVYVRRRIGEWPALFAAVLLLFLGPAWQVLLWPFEVGFVGSAAAGIAMLLMLERDDERGDVYACALLTLSIAFNSLGIPFAVAAAIDVLMKWRSRGLRRAYIPAIPLALFAVWYLGWGHAAQNNLSLHNVLASPLFVLNGIAASVDSLLGLSTITVEGAGQPDWGRPILVALILLVIYKQVRKPGFSPRLWPVLGAALTFWLLTAFNYIPGREAVASRYMHTAGLFVLLVAADLLQGARFSRRALAIGGLVTLLAIASNLIPLRDGRDYLRVQTQITRGDLAAIEIARETVDPYFALAPDIAGTGSLIDISAGTYLQAAAEDGSPAYSPSELAVAPKTARLRADVVLAHALPLTTDTRAGISAVAGGDCVRFPGAGAPAAELRLTPGVTRVEVEPGAPAVIHLRRFATGEYSLNTDPIPGGTTTLIEFPPDRVESRWPWYLQVEADQPARVCRR